MTWLLPLPVFLPLLAGALLVGAAPLCPRRVADVVGIVVAATCCGTCAYLAWCARETTLVYWFGGWRPRGGLPLGIAFVVDPFGAGAAAFAAGLMTAALSFAWWYFETVRTYFHATMMIFLAGMEGFVLTGDLFNQFVFFELMGVAAYALTGYKVEDANAVEGAINFAVTNTIGAFLVLIGLALLYGRTGDLNLAAVGEALRHGMRTPLVPAAFALIAAGYFVKAAVVPFHFWLADAHAVAPTPVCVLFSGIMIELGVFGALRVYETVFRGAAGLDANQVRVPLMAFGAATALLGALMCFVQRHFKRLLAFSSVSHVGMILLGAALLSPTGIGGAALYAVGHGLVKGALFMGAGLLLHRLGGVDQIQLHGRARKAPLLGVVVTVAALGLTGFPPWGTYVGKQLMEEAAKAAGAPWVTWIFFAASVLTGAAVLRFAGAVFLGWGSAGEEQRDAPTDHEQRETDRGLNEIPAVMLGTAAVLSVLPAAMGFWSAAVAKAFLRAAVRFSDDAGYASTVLHGARTLPGAAESFAISLHALLVSLATVAVAVLLAVITLFRNRWPAAAAEAGRRWVRPARQALSRLHSGNVADYVTWLVVGTVVLGWWIA